MPLRAGIFCALALAAAHTAPNCTSTTLVDTDLCPGFAGYRTAEVPGGEGVRSSDDKGKDTPPAPPKMRTC